MAGSSPPPHNPRFSPLSVFALVVDPEDVPRIVADAAALIGRGRIVIFGSGALAFWLRQAPRSRDVDLWCEPAERGETVEALMGELSWYHERHGTYVEVWQPETFAAPLDWISRAQTQTPALQPGVTVVIPHPHDVILAKLERHDPQDFEHIRLILDEFPLSEDQLQALVEQTPYSRRLISNRERVNRFLHGLDRLRELMADRWGLPQED